MLVTQNDCVRYFNFILVFQHLYGMCRRVALVIYDITFNVTGSLVRRFHGRRSYNAPCEPRRRRRLSRPSTSQRHLPFDRRQPTRRTVQRYERPEADSDQPDASSVFQPCRKGGLEMVHYSGLVWSGEL